MIVFRFTPTHKLIISGEKQYVWYKKQQSKQTERFCFNLIVCDEEILPASTRNPCLNNIIFLLTWKVYVLYTFWPQVEYPKLLMSRVYFCLCDVSHCTPEPHSKPSSCLCSNPILDYAHTHTRTFWNNCFTLAVLLKYSKHVLRNNFRRNPFIWMYRGSQWRWAASLRCGAGVKPCWSSAIRSLRPNMCLFVCFLKVVFVIFYIEPQPLKCLVGNTFITQSCLRPTVDKHHKVQLEDCKLCFNRFFFFFAQRFKLMFLARDKQAVLVATLYFAAALFPLLPLLLFLAPFTLRQLLSEISDLLWSAVLSQPNIFSYRLLLFVCFFF